MQSVHYVQRIWVTDEEHIIHTVMRNFGQSHSLPNVDGYGSAHSKCSLFPNSHGQTTYLPSFDTCLSLNLEH